MSEKYKGIIEDNQEFERDSEGLEPETREELEETQETENEILTFDQGMEIAESLVQDAEDEVKTALGETVPEAAVEVGVEEGETEQKHPDAPRWLNSVAKSLKRKFTTGATLSVAALALLASACSREMDQNEKIYQEARDKQSELEARRHLRIADLEDKLDKAREEVRTETNASKKRGAEEKVTRLRAQLTDAMLTEEQRDEMEKAKSREQVQKQQESQKRAAADLARQVAVKKEAVEKEKEAQEREYMKSLEVVFNNELMRRKDLFEEGLESIKQQRIDYLKKKNTPSYQIDQEVRKFEEYRSKESKAFDDRLELERKHFARLSPQEKKRYVDSMANKK